MFIRDKFVNIEVIKDKINTRHDLTYRDNPCRHLGVHLPHVLCWYRVDLPILFCSVYSAALHWKCNFPVNVTIFKKPHILFDKIWLKLIVTLKIQNNLSPNLSLSGQCA